MRDMILAYPGSEHLADPIGEALGLEVVKRQLRHFPDGESHVNIDTDVEGARVWLVGSLERPDEKFLPMALTVETLRDLGAVQVVLVAPYLSYMRQDHRFHPGEGVTSRYFARLISQLLDGMVTLDPHLHRTHSLDEIYSIPTVCARSTGPVAAWIEQHVQEPLLVGPDAESAQWIERLAEALEAPSVVFEKVRHGDRDVTIESEALEAYQGCTPVIFDDIVSTGKTMAVTLELLERASLQAAVCVGVHAVFSDDAGSLLQRHGAARLITCNTIAHETNAIDVSAPLTQGCHELREHLDSASG